MLRHPRRLAVALACALLCAQAAARPAAAATRHPTRVTAVRSLPARAVAGRTIALRVTTKPTRARLRVLLSKDAKPGKSDVALAGLTRRGAKLTGRVPAAVRPGRYRVLVCPAVAHPRCIAAKGRLKVTAPPAPTPAPAPAPAPAPPSLGNDIVPTPTPTPTPVPVDLPSFDAPPAPRNVTPQLESGRTVTATIGTGGGTLTATGADGSTFTLTIPPGALPDDVPATMTPVTAIPDLPFTEAPPAAVQLGPDGLQLARPASLKIVPAHPAPAGEQVGFGWHGAGQSLFLEPVSGGTLELWHFSGGGLGGATPAQFGAQEQAIPNYALDRYLQQLAAGPLDQVDVAVAFYDARVGPDLANAAQHPEYVTSAVQEGNVWSHQVAALGLQGDPRINDRLTRVQDAMSAALIAGFADARKRCGDESGDEPGAAGQIGRMLGIAHLADSLGVPLGDAFTDIESCARFGLDYDYTGTSHYPAQDGIAHWKADDVKLRWDDTGRLQWTGSAPLTLVRWQNPSPAAACPNKWSDGGTFWVAGQPLKATLRLDFLPQTTLDPATGRERDDPSPPRVTLILNPGGVADKILYCPSDGGPVSYSPGVYWNSWESTHADEFSLDTRLFTLQDTWAPSLYNPFAIYSRQESNGIWGSDTYIQLRHTPGAD